MCSKKCIAKVNKNIFKELKHFIQVRSIRLVVICYSCPIALNINFAETFISLWRSFWETTKSSVIPLFLLEIEEQSVFAVLSEDIQENFWMKLCFHGNRFNRHHVAKNNELFYKSEKMSICRQSWPWQGITARITWSASISERKYLLWIPNYKETFISSVSDVRSFAADQILQFIFGLFLIHCNLKFTFVPDVVFKEQSLKGGWYWPLCNFHWCCSNS